MSKSQAVRNVWTLLSEEAEKSGLATMYSVKFAEEHKLWQDCLDPRVRSVAGLHRLLGDGTILSSVSLLTGVESMRNRMKAADLIETYWGADWFSAMPDSMKSDTWDCATAMPRSVLEEIRDNAKQGIPRHEAFAKWAEVIALRSDYGKRTELGIKGPAGPTLVYTDAAWLNPDKGKKRKGKVAGQALLKSKLPTHSAFSILGPTVASKPDSTQPQATITLKRKRDATDAVAAGSRRRLDASDKAGEGPGDDTEEWRLEADGVTVRRRVKNQLQRRLLEPGEELPKRAEAEDYKEEEEEEEEEDVEEDVEEEDGEEGDGKKGDGEKRDGIEKDGEERDGKERNGREEDHSGRNTNEKEGDTDEPIVVSATTRTLNGQGFNAEANLIDLIEEEKRDKELKGSSERGHVANSRCERLDYRGPDFARITAS